MKKWLLTATMIVISSLTSPVLADTTKKGVEKVIEALLSCDPSFFTVLKEEQKAFGTATIKPYSEIKVNPDNKNDIFERKGNIVTFVKSVEVYGLPIIGFIQMEWGKAEEADTYWWAFETSAETADIAKALTTLSKDAQFKNRDKEYGWVQELDPEWRYIGDSAIETQVPLRMVLLRPSVFISPTASNFGCIIDKTRMEAIKTLPDASELFVVAP